MIPAECKFDPKRDLQEVQQGLSPDLDAALRTGIVADSGDNLDYNGIDDPSQILGVVRDKFDAVDAQRAIRKYGKRAHVENYVQNEKPGSPSVAPAAGGASPVAPAAPAQSS